MILLLIPLAGLVLGVGLWIGLRGLEALSLGGSTRPERESWRERRGSRERFSFASSGSSGSSGSSSQGVREWAERIPPGWLIAVIAATGVWVLGWLVILIVGLNFLS